MIRLMSKVLILLFSYGIINWVAGKSQLVKVVVLSVMLSQLKNMIGLFQKHKIGVLVLSVKSMVIHICGTLTEMSSPLLDIQLGII